MDYGCGEARLHVPIFTNPHVAFLIDGRPAPMQTGELWYMNTDLPHSVVNRGTTDRIHMVIDSAISPWLDAQLGHLT